eukprot:TRINITY_DN3005_c0_g1_i1.p1 TRINITY_DN3005_c0_g1~~TRINITY_DN3005_c0_g1_i1.p1  ORF type:complete len:604 (+),score=206.27 TRINITY_DN3005_c0_g1_i1:60-1871(+)
MVGHYDLLGVQKCASEADIRRAFKKMALKLHPDKNPEGETMFKKVAEAYNVLVHKRTRTEYDNGLEAASMAQQKPFAGHSEAGTAPPTPTWQKNPRFYEEVQRRRSESEAQQRRQTREFAAANVNFSDWYRSKVEAQQRATNIAEEKIRDLQAKQEAAEQLEAEERAAAAVKEVHMRQEQEERKRQQQEENEKHKRRIENQQRLQEEIMQRQKAEEWSREKESREKETESSLLELASNRKKLQREKEQLAAEVRGIEEMDPAVKRANQEKREEMLERTLKDAEDNLTASKKRAEDLQRQRVEREKQNKLNADREAAHAELMRQQLQKTEARWKEDEEKQQKSKQMQACEIAKMNRQMMMDAKNARLQHEADLKAMREETEKMERDMLARLEAVRKAKREGRFVDLSQLTLDGELKSLEPIIMHNKRDETSVRVGSCRSLSATHGSVVGKGLAARDMDDSDDDMPLLRKTYHRAAPAAHTPSTPSSEAGSGSSSPTPSPPGVPRGQQAPRSREKEKDEYRCESMCQDIFDSPNSVTSSSLARAAYHLQDPLHENADSDTPSALHSPAHGRRSTRSSPSPNASYTRDAAQPDPFVLSMRSGHGPA